MNFFPNADRRTIWLRVTLLTATFLGLIASMPVWFNTRTFPLLPIVSGFPILPAPLDKCLYALMLASLVSAVWFYRQAVIVFLATSFFAYCSDQNRGQPWLYMYWVLLLLSLFPAPSALAACRCAVSVIYIWCGIQKFNSRFFVVTPEWFVAPAANWHLPQVTIDLLKLSVKSAPFIELAIGLLLWFPKLRRAAFIAVILTHAFALLFLGPLGHNYNWVVWPWNLAMIALVLGLFAREKLFEKQTPATVEASKLKLDDRSKKAHKTTPAPTFASFSGTFSDLRRSRPALCIIALFALLPVLSYSGRWDSYFSFSLYSENLAVANIFVSESFRDNLPPHLKNYAQKFPQAYDPQHQGPYTFSFTAWAYEELHIPPISEPRNFVNVYRTLLPYAKHPGDLRMIIGPRSGPVVFHEGNRVEYLQRSN